MTRARISWRPSRRRASWRPTRAASGAHSRARRPSSPKSITPATRSPSRTSKPSANFAGLAREAGLRDPDGLAAQLLLLMDGAWVAARRFGPDNHAASWPTQPGSSSTPTLRRRPETGWANSVALETDLARRAVCAIETTGRRSGPPRLIEIQFAAD